MYKNTVGEVVLRISNFSIEDYGVFRCHCVNDFTLLQYEECGEAMPAIRGLPTHCSATKEIQLLPSSGIIINNASKVLYLLTTSQSRIYFIHIDQFMGVQTEFVDTPGETVSLGSCTSVWTRIGSSGLREDNANAEITVTSPQDQAKFICGFSDTLQKIAYVTITGQATIVTTVYIHYHTRVFRFFPRRLSTSQDPLSNFRCC